MRGQAQNLHGASERNRADFLPMSPSRHKQMVAENLERILEAIGGSRAAIARRLEVSPSKLGNWIRGDNYPDPYTMWRLCEEYGVTMDWIYRGRTYGLPVELAVGLRAVTEA